MSNLRYQVLPVKDVTHTRYKGLFDRLLIDG